MKFARMGELGSERPVVIDGDDVAFDLTSLTSDIDRRFFESDGIERARNAMADGDLPAVDISMLRWGSPIATPGLLMCVGLNYRQHAIETGADFPDEPILFMKSPRCVIGPNDPVVIPRHSTKTDWEVELAVVIGTRAHYLDSPADSAQHIAGFAISNDVSEREFQLERGGQWVKGKSCESFNPLGPYLVTPDEVDGQRLGMELSVNGELRQSSTTSDMIFEVDHLIWYVSQFMVLEPGDVINTGTPAGVALGLPGTPYLRAGDEMQLTIEGLGTQTQIACEANS